MKKILLVVMLLLPFISICPAYADGARITTEYEVEKNQKTGMVNDSFTVIPGYQFTNTYISSIEFLMEGNRDRYGEQSVETKYGIRLRKNFNLDYGFSGYIRGLVGVVNDPGNSYPFGYIEPGLKYTINDTWSFTTSYRMIDSLNGSQGHQVNKIRIGPNYKFDDHNDIELRYVHGEGDQRSDAAVFEYTYKF